MYGLDPETDVSFLSGPQLTQVAVGTYQVSLHFTESVDISIEAGARSQESSGEPQSYHSLPDLGCYVVGLLDQHVTTTSIGKDGELALEWSDGSVLTIFDSNPESESYQLISPDHYIVV